MLPRQLSGNFTTCEKKKARGQFVSYCFIYILFSQKHNLMILFDFLPVRIFYNLQTIVIDGVMVQTIVFPDISIH